MLQPENIASVTLQSDRTQHSDPKRPLLLNRAVRLHCGEVKFRIDGVATVIRNVDVLISLKRSFGHYQANCGVLI